MHMKISEFRDKEKTTNRKSGASSSTVAKAGLWYTVCNFCFRGMAFITTPFFSRLMSKSELGTFSNYSSWITILIVVTSFDLSQSIIRSKLDYEDDIDSYISSILALSTIWTALVYGITCIFMPTASRLLSIEPKYVHIMFLYLFASPAYLMLVTKHRAFYKYKLFVALTGITTVTGTLFSLLLVFLMQDKLAGRIIGYYTPYIVIGAVVYIYIFIRSRSIKISYWKEACSIMLPLVPHVLSLYLLSSSDKIIITRLCGAEYTAIYSIAYSAYHIVTILFDSMNKAWAPWLLDSLHNKNYKQIMAVSKKYIGAFIILIVGVFMLVPEIILVLGGRGYLGAVYCLPPLIASCVFQLIYTMYVNIEFYEKKTFGVSIATIIATVINIILNFIFIPMSSPGNSYVIAAYTTLTGYIVLFVLHYCIVKRMKMDFVYDIKFIFVVLVITLAVSGIMNALYSATVIRYVLIVAYCGAVVFFGCRHKEEILEIFGKRKAA